MKQAILKSIVKVADPDSEFISARKLSGGISATMTLLEVSNSKRLPGYFILRQPSRERLHQDPNAAAHEYQLLCKLEAMQLPVPKPYFLDESLSILPTPYLVISFMNGAASFQASNLSVCLQQLAEVLVKIQVVKPTKTGLAFLTNQQRLFSEKLSQPPTTLHESLSESYIRDRLGRIWPPLGNNQPVLLHGDLWLGNTIWDKNKLVGVIDWEFAAIGDPLADVANLRQDLFLTFGLEAMLKFTQHYRALAAGVDFRALPVWDLCAALRAAEKMHEWKIDQKTRRVTHERHRIFVEMAVTQLEKQQIIS